jgi:putative selenate reductase molybdopterin-binding subunit
MTVTGNRALSLYRCPNLRYRAQAVYTNLPVAGAFRGYGCPQGFFALESHVDEVALALGEDPLAFRKRNHVREGDDQPIAVLLGEGREGHRQVVRSCGLPEAIAAGAQAVGWGRKRRKAVASGPLRRGLGMAIAMQASGIPGVDMGAASIKMNEDGSFNLLMGATDLGTGADTALCQIAAETLGVSVDRILPYTSDTDLTPFDPGAYASSTTFVSGGAVEKAARAVREQILQVAARLLATDAKTLSTRGGRVHAPDGRWLGYEEISLSSLYQKNQFQIMAVASHTSTESPAPFAAVFAEVEVDIETGVVRVLKILEAVDCGQVINPQMAEGQVEGAALQALGYAVAERMPLDENGRAVFRSFRDYTIARAVDAPEIVTLLVPTHEPTGPFGAKAVAEIPINAPAPAIANAVAHAIGVRIRELPLTPDRVLAALTAAASAPARG